ncbi:MAG: peptidoglycan bridge formation glycyltransferase FemA/FemB family protein [Candidatus Berkelbacteria bacterium]
MKYNLAEIQDKKIWESFISGANYHSFLQSWNWGECQLAQGDKIFRIGIFCQDELVAIIQLIKIIAKRGTYLLCPHGPVFKNQDDLKNAFGQIDQYITQLAKSEKCDFIRICPTVKNNQENLEIFKKFGFRKSPIHTHPEISWILDIFKTNDQLLAEMRKTTRYMIKRSQKEGARVEISANPDDLEKFWRIYSDTAKRQKFTTAPKNILKSEFDLFLKDNQIRFFFGQLNDEVIVAAMIVFYGDSAYYHNSGSLKKHEKIGISHLVQWEAIQEAKNRGLKFYNFWGISPEDKPSHPWAGLSMFKKGFGGGAEYYLPSQDKPITKKYFLNFAIEKLRSIKRGYN